jgi:hypothetical protein
MNSDNKNYDKTGAKAANVLLADVAASGEWLDRGQVQRSH